MRFFRTYPLDESGSLIHLEGPGDSYTLCGFDTAGDDHVHRVPPQQLPRPYYKITCPDCLQIISRAREYIKSKPK